ncbi:MAG: BamA/TamA family outer membrane protein [Bacteroidales bacterium]|nr:BamA/TamA family outer membrane protein [Candidatus Cryptobacteroides caccocaballi]
MKRIAIAALCLALCSVSYAETKDSTPKEKKAKKEVKYDENGKIIKTGLNFGPLPAVAFDADKGFQLGGILNIYNFGDGSKYPNYFSKWYLEASYFTKGSMLFQVQYDNKELIPGIRWSSAASLTIDKAFDFYGFNGYQSFYDADRIAASNNKKDIKKGLAEPNPYLYRYTPFYRFSKSTFFFKTDFIGHITDHFYWEAGYHFRYFHQDEIDRVSINKNKDYYDTFPSGPDTYKNAKFPDGMEPVIDDRPYQPTLFELYKSWGIIGENEIYDKNGKANMFDSSVRLGLMYDSRDKEGAPSRGIWAEGHVLASPKWLGSSVSNYRYSLTFRQYVPLVKNDILTFAYRLNYEGTIGKFSPYYTYPYITVVGNDGDKDGNGGYRTVRGILRDRVMGLDQASYTAEFRYKFVDFRMGKQNVAFSITAFSDGAMVTRQRDITYKGDGSDYAVYEAFMSGRLDEHNYPEKYIKVIDNGAYGKIKTLKEMPHITAGLGLRFIMNSNFIVAAEYGMPITRFFNEKNPYRMQDGKGAFYINTGYLF